MRYKLTDRLPDIVDRDRDGDWLSVPPRRPGQEFDDLPDDEDDGDDEPTTEDEDDEA